MQHARLGLVVGKKAVSKATERNRIKRVIREHFRKAGAEMPAVDLVVRVVAPVDRLQLHRHMDRLLTELEALEANSR